mgnify:CR=1 FL=1
MMILGTGVVVLAILAGFYFYFQREEKPPLLSAEEAAQDITEALPEITTNPLEGEVPELNPVDKVNPFKYENPLR